MCTPAFSQVEDSILGTEVELVTPQDGERTPAEEGSAESTLEENQNDERSVAEIARETTLITGKKVFAGLLILLFTWLVVRVLKKVLETFSERSTRHRIAIKGLIPVVTILLWSLACYVIIVNVFSPPRQTLLAGMASLGLALGLSANAGLSLDKSSFRYASRSSS